MILFVPVLMNARMMRLVVELVYIVAQMTGFLIVGQQQLLHLLAQPPRQFRQIQHHQPIPTIKQTQQ
jgi:hypothetical protein